MARAVSRPGPTILPYAQTGPPTEVRDFDVSHGVTREPEG